MLKQQFFGIEVEMTGLTRMTAATALAVHFNTEAHKVGDIYDKHEITDHEGKIWTLMYDSSIGGLIKTGRGYSSTADKTYRVELVSPKLEYSEIEKLQEVVRTLRKAGATTTSTCGIHIHVDGKNHDVKSLKNCLTIMYSKEDLLYKALQVGANRASYCKKTNQRILDNVRKKKNLTMEELQGIWYQTSNKEQSEYCANQHYHNSRYHCLNIHPFFSKGTIEFRLFNSTLHAGEVKAFVHLALAISAQGITQKTAQAKKTASDNEKFTFRTWLLRLGLNGEEFKNTRMHLLKNLDGNAAWRYAPSNYATHPHTLALAANQ